MKKQMRIAQVAPLWFGIPPNTWGGTERIVSYLTEELIKRGHDVTLFATADSKTEATLIPIWPRGLWTDANIGLPEAVFGLLYKELLERQGEFDIIHDHCEHFTSPFTPFLKPPVVTTLHHMLVEENTILYKKFPQVQYVAISKDEQRSGPGINIVKTIYHGIPVEKYGFSAKPKDYLLWLSLISPDKGLAEAIEITQMAGEKLIISGPILPQHADYFEYRIKPLIDGKQIQFVGACDHKKKVRLLKNAKAFLFPIFKRREPFGLVVIEAMACGTPVIASSTGSMPEIIKDKETGFLVESKEEAVGAVQNIASISRTACKEHVENNFSLKTMVDNYEALYEEILAKKPVKMDLADKALKILLPRKS